MSSINTKIPKSTESRSDGQTQSAAKVQVGGFDSEGVWHDISVEGDALHITHSTHFPGARNETSETIDYLRAISTGTGTRSTNGTTEEVITASPAILIAVIANSSHVGSPLIRNAAAIGGGADQIIDPTFVAGTPYPIGIKFDTGITIQGSDVANDVTLVWAEL